MTKKLVIVLNTSWNIYNFRLNLLKALQNEGWEIIAITPKDTYSEKLMELGIAYYEIDMNNKGTNPLEDIKLLFSLLHLYRSINPTVILHYTIKPNIYGSIAAGLLKIPSISNISGLGTVFLTNNLSSKIAKFLYKIAMLFPEKVFFQNNDDHQLFLDLGLVSPHKTELVPGSGIDTSKFSPLKTECNSAFTFLFIARLVKDKGLLEYIAACRLLNQKYLNVKFQILGALYDGNPTAIQPDDLQIWIKEQLIDYLGVSDDVHKVIGEADCIVLPSYREGLSRVLLEAASMAKPLVTTNVPGCRDVVEDGINGFLCNAKDTKSLFEAMEKMLLLDNDARITMGIRGREKAIQQFDETIVIDTYKNAIHSII